MPHFYRLLRLSQEWRCGGPWKLLRSYLRDRDQLQEERQQRPPKLKKDNLCILLIKALKAGTCCAAFTLSGLSMIAIRSNPHTQVSQSQQASRCV